jgi:hypothetical protein
MSETDAPRAGWADPDMAEMERVAADLGKKGDLQAIDVSRRLRESRGRLIPLDLPPVHDLAGVAAAQAAVIAALGAGKIAPSGAMLLSSILDKRRQSFLGVELEERIEALERGDVPPTPPGDRK